MRRILLLLVALFAAGGVSGQVYAQTEGAQEGSLEWQKINLQRAIEKRIQDALEPVVGKDKILVSVQVDMVRRAAPQRRAAQPQDENASLLSKLGIDDQIVVVDEIDPKKQDFFEQIRGVEVTLIFDESIPDETRTRLELVARKFIGNMGNITPRIKTESLALVQAQDAQRSQRPLLEILVDFKLELAILFFGMMVFFTGAFVVLRVARLESKKMDIMESFVGLQREKHNIETQRDEREEVIEDAIEAGTEANLSQNIHDQFVQLLKDRPKMIGALARDWLRSNDRNIEKLLAYIAQKTSPLLLEPITSDLSAADKRAWKKALKLTLAQDELMRIERLLSKELMGALLETSLDLDPDSQGLLESMTAGELEAWVSKDQSILAVLLNALPQTRSAELMARLPLDVVEAQFANAMALDPTQVRLFVTSLKKQSLNLGGTNVARASFAPLADRLPELAATLSTEKETMIYRSLVKQGQRVQALQMALQNIPSAIVLDLDDAILRTALMGLRSRDRCDLIYGLGQFSRERLLSVVGEPGKKMRDMLDVELAEIESDAARKALIEVRGDELWSSYLGRVRVLVRDNMALRVAVQPKVIEWLARFDVDSGFGRRSGSDEAA